MSAPAIALYLGESYASLGAFDLSQALLFEKSVFLPQVSLKNLLMQTKQNLTEHLSEEPVRFFIVTKYLDRLKNFRLGGSVTQVVCAGFENSYSSINSKSLSLAAASLVVSVSPETLTESFLTEELARIKKINPDSNKVVIQLSEKKFSAVQLELVQSFFTAAGFKIFNCAQPENLAEVRKTLLNAGTEGTKEEIFLDIKEIFGENTEILFWCEDRFKTTFQNYELFGSSSSFVAYLSSAQDKDLTAYFDHECFRLICSKPQKTWNSPWGSIPSANHDFKELLPHPFSEVRLDHLSMISISAQQTQHEPGPVCAGRGIKPLVLDLFSDEISQIPLMKSLFVHFHTDNQKQKLENHFSVLEKGQVQNLLKTQRLEVKKHIIESFNNELKLLSRTHRLQVSGPLASLFDSKSPKFNWPTEIIQKALV